MDISSYQAVGVQGLAAAGANDVATTKDLGEASRQFEAVLIRQFLGDSLKPLLHDTPESKAPGAQIYQYMMTDAIAESMSKEGVFGLSSMLQMQLSTAVEDTAGDGKPAADEEPEK
jgi:Rod binding domain-containing protein